MSSFQQHFSGQAGGALKLPSVQLLAWCLARKRRRPQGSQPYEYHETFGSSLDYLLLSPLQGAGRGALGRVWTLKSYPVRRKWIGRAKRAPLAETVRAFGLVTMKPSPRTLNPCRTLAASYMLCR